MAGPKTKMTKGSPTSFIYSLSDEQKRKDSLKLLDIYKSVTGEKPKMWGESIIGFGVYHLKAKKSSQEANWPLAAFSPRKQYLTLYVMPQETRLGALLKNLGKHKTSKACLYINKLSQIDEAVLKKVVAKSYDWAKKKYRAI